METLLVDDPVYWINSSEKIFFCRLLAMRRKLFSTCIFALIAVEFDSLAVFLQK